MPCDAQSACAHRVAHPAMRYFLGAGGAAALILCSTKHYGKRTPLRKTRNKWRGKPREQRNCGPYGPQFLPIFTVVRCVECVAQPDPEKVVPGATQPMCKPPFSEKSAPVEKPDSSDESQAQIDAISSGAPSRLTGMVATILSSTSWRIDLTISVAIYPGETVLTVTPLVATSCANAIVKPCRPALAVE